MVSPLLQKMAEKAGVSPEQAEALVKEMRQFTHGMASAGDVAIPPFSWDEQQAKLLPDFYAEWEGLSHGQYYGARAAVIWRAICDDLLERPADDHYDWMETPFNLPARMEDRDDRDKWKD